MMSDQSSRHSRGGSDSQQIHQSQDENDTMDDGSEDGVEEEGVIRLMATDCKQLFHEGLSRTDHVDALPPKVLAFVKEYQRRFAGWCSFLGVFAKEDASLDSRLRRHPSLQDIILRLLDILRDNLLLVVEYRPKPDQASNGPHEDTSEVLSDLHALFSGIEQSIRRLNKMGISIRSSSRSTIVARARRFADR